jgi:hypothetical protein
MSKETKKQEPQLPAVAQTQAVSNVQDLHTQAAAQSAKMRDAGIETKDLEIPKLMLMQPMSDAVGAQKAKFGELINTMDGSVVGGVDAAPVEIIPLKQFKTVRIYDMTSQPPKFIRSEPDDGKNSNFENREGNENGIPVKRVLNMNFFVLIKKEIDADEAFPAVVSFKSTSIPAGKQVATQMFKMIQLDKAPYSKTIMLGAKRETKDKKTWAVFEIGKGGLADQKAITVAEKWLVSLAAAQNVIIVGDNEDNDMESDVSNSPAPAPTVVGNEPSAQGPY